jgi:hypothetical protein
MAWLLLLLLTKLLRRLLDLPALLSAVVLGFMHRALWTTLIAAGWLTWVLVTAWTTPPTSRCSYYGGSTVQQLFLVAILLLLFTAALGSSICMGLVSLPYLWSRLCMPSVALCSPGAFLRQAEELRDVLHIVCG